MRYFKFTLCKHTCQYFFSHFANLNLQFAVKRDKIGTRGVKGNFMKEENKLSSQRISESLADNRMRPAELSEKTGISKSAISLYISGGRIPNRDKAEILGKALGVSPVWLMGFDAPKYVEATVEEKDLLLTYFAQLTPDQQTSVLNLIKNMV